LKSQKPIRVPDYKKDAENPLKNGSFLGVAFHPTEKIVYLSGGDEGTVIVYDYEHFKKLILLKLMAYLIIPNMKEVLPAI